MRTSTANLHVLGATLRTDPVRPSRPRILNFAFTFGGAVFIGISLLVGLAAVSAEANMLYVCFGLCLGAMIVSGTLSTRAITGIVLTRACPQAVSVGQPCDITYVLTNTKRRGRCYSVRVKEALQEGVALGPCEGYVTRIDAGQSAVLTIPARGDRRGKARLTRVVVQTRFPFGMFTKFTRASPESDIFILPALGRLLQPLLPTSSLARQRSDRQRQARGWFNDEFYGIREYRRGDNPKLIHWRRSARTGALVIRQMRDDPRRHLMVIFNPYLDGPAQGFGRRESTRDRASRSNDQRSADQAFELAIQCAATCCVTGLESGILVGLVILGKTPLVLPPVAGVEHRLDFLKTLATLEPCHDYDPIEVAAMIRWQDQWQGHGLLIAATEATKRRSDEATKGLAGSDELQIVLTRHCRSMRSFVAGSEAFDRFFEPAARTELLTEATEGATEGTEARRQEGTKGERGMKRRSAPA